MVRNLLSSEEKQKENINHIIHMRDRIL